MNPGPLQGLRILVTRPARQAGPLCDLIRAAGGEPVRLPALAIEPPRDPASAGRIVARLTDFDLAIFISPNAAEQGLALIREHGGLPPSLRVAALGERTAGVLVQSGAHVHITAPPPFNSEALLTRPEFQSLAGRRVVIFRGEGGREHLAKALRARGATVIYAEVYRRVAPDADLGAVVGGPDEINLVVVTSADALDNLLAMAEACGRRGWLLSQRLAVISERLARRAVELGFEQPALVAPQAADRGLIDAIAAWRAGAQAAQ